MVTVCRRTMPRRLNGFARLPNQGYAAAQGNLGSMYYSGQGVPQNYIQAHMWSDLAASNPASDKEVHNNAVSARDLAASKLTPAQIAEAQRLAAEWTPK
jgi:uncharacterized protein